MQHPTRVKGPPMNPRLTHRFARLALLTFLLGTAGHPRPCTGYEIGLFRADLPGQDPVTARQLVATLDRAGLATRSVTAQQLIDPAQLAPAKFDLLILPSCDRLPARSMPVIARFVAGGGDLLALGTPAFTRPLWRAGDQWYSRADWRRRLARQHATHVLLSFDRPDEFELRRASSSPDTPASRTLVDGEQGKALRVHLDDIQGWDTLVSSRLDHPFAAGHALTCLLAKGSKATRKLSFEWKERDGSRWIAVFPVTEAWQQIVLTPEDFHYWHSVPQRGKPGDCFHPENAVQFAIGLAHSHTGYQEGAQDYAVDQIGTAPMPHGAPPAVALRSPPRIEGLSPDYKFYDLHDVDHLAPRAAWLQSIKGLPTAPSMCAHHPRPTGKGFHKGRAWRWIPLLDAFGPKGQWRGAPASMFVDFAGPLKQSVRATISVRDHAWYQQPAQQRMLLSIVRHMATGLFLQEAGTEFFTYRPGQEVRAGARVANLSKIDSKTLTIRFSLRRADQIENRYFGNRSSRSPRAIRRRSSNGSICRKTHDRGRFILTCSTRIMSSTPLNTKSRGCHPVRDPSALMSPSMTAISICGARNGMCMA